MLRLLPEFLYGLDLLQGLVAGYGWRNRSWPDNLNIFILRRFCFPFWFISLASVLFWLGLSWIIVRCTVQCGDCWLGYCPLHLTFLKGQQGLAHAVVFSRGKLNPGVPNHLWWAKHRTRYLKVRWTPRDLWLKNLSMPTQQWCIPQVFGKVIAERGNWRNRH